MTQTALILGGARSGKSRRALTLAEARGENLLFIATAEAWDDEMKHRIAHHKQERGPKWSTIETPIELASTLASVPRQYDVCVVDCLTLWLSNIMHKEKDTDAETDRLCETLSSAPVPIICVSNEVGLGLVPDTPLGRAFRDAQGRLNQAVASACNRVEFIAAGLPIKLKG